MPSPPPLPPNAGKAQLNQDVYSLLRELQQNCSGSIVEVDLRRSPGVLDAAYLKPLLVFSPATAASEVIISGSGAKPFGTTFRGLQITVIGSPEPALTLKNMRFEHNTDEPAILVQDLGKLLIHDCVFDKNPGAAIRLLSGDIDVSYSFFTNNGGPSVRGGALQLLGGTAKVMQTLFEANNAAEGGAIFIEGADVALGNRTTLLRNLAAGAPNSIHATNGTLRYILPAPLGRWIGPARETEALPIRITGTAEVVSVLVKADVQRLIINGDFPFACQAGYFREQDTPEAQYGPLCESMCPPGTWCPTGAVTPLPCFNGSYCPEGSEYPIPCPAGTWGGGRADLASASDCDPCPIGRYCPLNTSELVPCGIGAYAPTAGHAECQLCPIGTYGDSIGSSNCSICPDGIRCPLGTTEAPCFPGEYREITSGSCLKAPLGMFAVLGATTPTFCPAGTHADLVGLDQCKQCPPGKYNSNQSAMLCNMVCPIGSFCPRGSTAPTMCADGSVGNITGASAQAQCIPAPLGHYGQGGQPVPCPVNTYQDQLGGIAEKDCRNCPSYSSTSGKTGQVHLLGCGCDDTFVASPDSASHLCVCPPGKELVSDVGGVSCLPCPLGSYKNAFGDTKCLTCKGGTTTLATGSLSEALCVCPGGFYMGAQEAEGCIRCDALTKPWTNCTEA